MRRAAVVTAQIAFIEYNKQQPIPAGFKFWARKDRGHILRKSCISLGERAIVRVFLHVGSDVSEVRSRSLSHVGCELRIRNTVELLGRSAGVGKVDQRVMPAQVIEPA